MKQYKYKINGNLYNVTVNDVEDNIANVEVNGTSYKVELDKPVKSRSETGDPSGSRSENGNRCSGSNQTTDSFQKDGVKSPLPGVILDIKVKEGDTVKRGQTIIILEAMKMENNINANKDGKVAEIKVNKGDSVLEGTDLVIIE